MRIIKQGKSLRTHHVITCTVCETVYEVTRSDCEHVAADPNDQRDSNHFTVLCPGCYLQEYIPENAFGFGG